MKTKNNDIYARFFKTRMFVVPNSFAEWSLIISMLSDESEIFVLGCVTYFIFQLGKKHGNKNPAKTNEGLCGFQFARRQKK